MNRLLRLVYILIVCVFFSCGCFDEVQAESGCVGIENDLSLSFPCVVFGENQYKFKLNPYTNINIPFGYYWKLDLTSVEDDNEDYGGGECTILKSDLSLTVSCAESGDKKFSFLLNTFKDPNNPFDPNYYWTLDLNSLEELGTDTPPDEPICDSTHLTLCDNSTCSSKGGYWYDGTCNNEPEQDDSAGLTGKILFTSNRDGDFELYVVNSDGTNLRQLTDNTDNDSMGRYSPDGSRILFTRNSESIWVMASDGSNEEYVCEGRNADFSPDGTKIVFFKYAGSFYDGYDLYIYDLNSRTTEHVTNWVGGEKNPDWSGERNMIAFASKYSYSGESYGNLHLLDPQTGSTQNLTNYDRWDNAFPNSPRWSPDGSKISYTISDHINIMAHDGTVLASRFATGVSACWSHDGKFIAYSDSNAKIRIKEINDSFNGATNFLFDASGQASEYPLDWISGDSGNTGPTIEDPDHSGDSGNTEPTIEDPEYSGDSGTFTDSRDGQVYKWVRIGDQVWMAENLNYEGDGHYCNGFAPGTPYSRVDEKGNITNGMYYNAYLGNPIPVPSGWHVPSVEEVEQLNDFIGSNGYPNNRGDALKSTSGWEENGNGLDAFGFNAFPSGNSSCSIGSDIGCFRKLGFQTIFWTSTLGSWDESTNQFVDDGFHRAVWVLNSSSSRIGLGYMMIEYEAPVRLIKD